MSGRGVPTEPEFKPELVALGQALRRERHAKGLTIKALARKAGISAGHLGQIERGQANLRMQTLYDLTEALGITSSQLVRAAEGEA